ncbi:MAG: pyridoxal 5'-phosphate synthase glutaminase subunit PdxT, partial [Armatimonadetes bacterium]|nr:pyridoxal 5'-phosphate synthase glutaminase subunit PdxT [Armatimonadota bacterium]
MRVGVLALQGDFAEHLAVLERLDCEAAPVKTAAAIGECDALVIPGGESTTIGKLLERFGLTPAIQALHEDGRPIFGTCAGVILLAKEIVGSDQFRLGFLEAEVARNAYGRQVDSFETALAVKGIEGDPVRAVFIRAPAIERVWGDCEVLAEFDGKPVLVRQGNLLGGTFHPELVGETRI